jgi:flagellar hook-basal body complex protein FliE
MAQISAVSQLPTVEPLRPAQESAQAEGFSQVLRSAVSRAEASGTEATQLMDRFMAGESIDLHTVAMAGQRASLQFEMLLQVRNKVVQAYQEVMRLQL